MTLMADEIRSIPAVVAHQLDQCLKDYVEAGASLRSRDPATIITCARGSSDHAALYFKYLIEMQIGLPVCSMGPSIASVYGTRLSVKKAALIAVSQSGGSTDLARLCQQAQTGGALTIALINADGSALADEADLVLPMAAGPENAVAATKTFVCSMVALAAICAGWQQNTLLISALRDLPKSLDRALSCDWSSALPILKNTRSLFVISRGPGLAVAEEAALKFKETCRLHAEAYSAAEVRHGPVALADREFTALSFGTRDASAASILQANQYMRDAGATVLDAASDSTGKNALSVARAAHVALDPICQIVSFYKFVEQLSVATHNNPDSPDLLSKVTVTV
jgi:glucosamine--fructose-6-phosphate aminotransferase (isomerizing)